MSAEKGTDPARLRAARGKNPGRSRAHNRRVVLDLMRGHGQLGRRQLAEMTQLTPQAVTNILDELIAAGLIEARGVGLLNAVPAGPVRLVLAAARGTPETERLPPERSVTYLGCSLPLLHDVGTGHFAPAILQYLKAGRRET